MFGFMLSRKNTKIAITQMKSKYSFIPNQSRRIDQVEQYQVG